MNTRNLNPLIGDILKNQLIKPKCKHESSTWNEDIGAGVCDFCNERVD